ncbi:hypothetical protein CYMTET_21831 [Cymbomonas tetramitiformis]|uniref:Uncharacterized protein n=1 Tax=Cymbomonas tetramitiformis TaxID=36881 RepID=A0AAE0G1E7_9CHLO|nr:hypothetical protein CYMTET_21831 [Cymbomonas tetramitiformis]
MAPTGNSSIPDQDKDSSPTKRQRTDSTTVVQVSQDRVLKDQVSEDQVSESNRTSVGSSVANLVTILSLLSSMSLATNQMQASLLELPRQVAKVVCQDLAPAAVASREANSRIAQDLRACHSIQDICAKFELKIYEEEGVMVCPQCFRHSTLAPRKTVAGRNRDIAGKFPSKLKNIKQRVKNHFESAVHEWCTEMEAREQLEASRVQDVGMTLGRFALDTIREAMSYSSYERAVLRHYLNGGRVGNINHGRKFVTSMLKSFHHVVVERLIAWFAHTDPATTRPTLFALNADKATEMRRTGQVVGALGFDVGKIKAVLLDDPPVVEGHTGLGLANNIFTVFRDTYRFFIFTLRSQLTGLGFDGQYFSLDVPEHLMLEKEEAFAHLLDKVFPELLDFQDKDAAKVPLDPAHFPTLCEHENEIVTKGTFKGVPLKIAPIFKGNFQKAFRSVCTKRLAVWCDLVLQYFSSRFLNTER